MTSTRPPAARAVAMSAVAALAVLASTVLTGCASGVAGHGQGRPATTATPSLAPSSTSTRPTATAPTVTTPPATTPTPRTSTSLPQHTDPSGPIAIVPDPTCPGTDPVSLTGCLRPRLDEFWSGELNQSIDEPVHVAAPASQVPASCRPAVTRAPAFTCRANLSLYVNAGLVSTIARLPDTDAAYAFESVQSHEFGHVLQYTLHQPEIEVGHPSDATQRYLEQQADCLSGVWAENSLSDRQRDAFHRVSEHLFQLVSTPDEDRTHGAPADRIRAVEHGLYGGHPQTCHLATFH